MSEKLSLWQQIESGARVDSKVLMAKLTRDEQVLIGTVMHWYPRLAFVLGMAFMVFVQWLAKHLLLVWR